METFLFTRFVWIFFIINLGLKAAYEKMQIDAQSSQTVSCIDRRISDTHVKGQHRLLLHVHINTFSAI